MKHKGKTIFRLLFAASALFLATSLPTDLNAQCDSPVGIQINEETKDGEVAGIKIYNTGDTDGCDTGVSVCGDVEVKGLLAIEENAEMRFSGSKLSYSGKAKFEGKGAVRVVDNEDCGTTDKPIIEGDGDCNNPEKTMPKLIVETSKDVRFLGKTSVKDFEFAKGKAVLEGDLCVKDVKGACDKSYFVTNSKAGATTGRLQTSFSEEIVLHVGNENEYAPIRLDNISGSQEFVGVRVMDGTFEEGFTGALMNNSSGVSWEVNGLSSRAQVTVTVATTALGAGVDFQPDRNFLSRYVGIFENTIGGYESDNKWDYTGHAGCGSVDDENPIVEACDTERNPSIDDYFGKTRSFDNIVMSDKEIFSCLTCNPNCPTSVIYNENSGYKICFPEDDGINIAPLESGEVVVNGKMETYVKAFDRDKEYENNGETEVFCITMPETEFYKEITIFGCTAPVVNQSLPVELVSFEATENNCDVVLTWQTASEDNNDFFEVQRSVDGRAYEKIGIVDGAGTTADVQNYRFVDQDPVAFAYYRLRQVDFDGTEDFSPIKRVNSSCFDRTVVTSLFPNPTGKNSVNLELASSGLGEIRVTISDVLGRQLQINTHDLTDGINNVKLDISQLSAGTYFIQVHDDVSAIGNPVKLVKTQQQ